jgi:hypothetical protein
MSLQYATVWRWGGARILKDCPNHGCLELTSEAESGEKVPVLFRPGEPASLVQGTTLQAIAPYGRGHA